MGTIDEILMLIIFAVLMVGTVIGTISLVELISPGYLKIKRVENVQEEEKLTDYSFMDNVDSYLIADTLKGGHYIDIKIKQDKDCTITKRIEAKTFKGLMEKTKVWCLENNK